mmetsp:Transcript_22991/g.50466  ORF Transcript_22991/g.50466 Transcript_22991/m.50466 type:complete len:315 (-) Transcript_22991:187-1131(-)|eukprot:CAMPEP_0202900004 /NCGR_PEP_ID=MMETSP1392-20130828/9377_1 /ASSEMBLY_ACC=CAM_ASM_000868 /TAXON_ID=225041 /ORGANISM="Chlamydomonas chlamydogama, Strain SAG 11-48b" /LENGTH=314 /DNA_ID=CAMNT_0049586311 /DNA_START=101 /DNA_END=1045 /DNA_ORIENTATION=+
MVKYSEGSFVNSRKQKLFTVSYVPDSAPSGVVLFQHGLGEYVGRYKDFFQRLAEQANVAVHAFDTHGHGKSEPTDEKGRFFCAAYEHFIDDAQQFLEEVVKPKHPGLPIIAAGHSLGGLNTVNLVLRKQDAFAGMILQSAAIDVEWTPLLRIQAVIGDCLASLVPYAQLVPAVRPEDMSQDPKVVEEYLNDKEIAHGNVKTRMANETLKGFRLAHAKQSTLKLPIYAAHGTSDRCTSLKAVKALLAAAASTDKTLNEVAGGYHEIMLGPEKDEVLRSMVDWIKAHVPGGAAAAKSGISPEQVQVKAEAQPPAAK